MKKSNVSSGKSGSREGEKMCKLTQEMGSQKHKIQMQMWAQYEPCCTLGVRLAAEELNMGICWEEKTRQVDSVPVYDAQEFADRALGVRLTAEELNMGICWEEKTRQVDPAP
jgi:hypothetical protein